MSVYGATLLFPEVCRDHKVMNNHTDGQVSGLRHPVPKFPVTMDHSRKSIITGEMVRSHQRTFLAKSVYIQMRGTIIKGPSGGHFM